MQAAILNLGILRCASQMQRHFPDDLVSDEPSTRGTESLADYIQAHLFGQIVKCPRSVRIESRTYSGTKPRLRMPNSMPPRTGFAQRSAVKFQRVLACNELDF